MDNRETLRLVYQYKSMIDDADIWLSLCNILNQEKLLSKKYEIDGKFRTIKKVEKLLSQGEFLIIKDEIFSFSSGGVWAGKLDQLIIEKEKKVKIDWDLWIDQLRNIGIFVYAWESDNEYNYWQNQWQIDSYKRGGRPYEHLLMKPSGEPLPLPQIVIDTSRNPGRNVFRTGYVEAVGSTMWLGDEFFALTGASKEAVKNCDWSEVTEIKPGIIKIKAQEECFIQSEGKEAELQNKMRDVLYPNHD